MPVPSPRNKILPVRGNIATLQANVASILDGEICYAIDQDQYYQNEGGTLVAVGATKAQGTLADSATQPGDNVSTLTNDAGYITSAGAPVQSVAGKTGVVTLVKADITDFSDADYATAAQGALADSATQPGDNVDTLGGIAITSPVAGEYLRYNGVSDFVNSAIGASDLPDLSGTYATAAQGALADTALQPGDIGVTVQGYDANTAKYDDVTANFTGTLQNGGSNVVVDSDIGVTVQAYDANLPAGNTILVDGDIGVTVQAYDANLPAGNTILVDGDVGVTVQAYDADNVVSDVAPTFTATVQTTERTITAGAFDLSTGNHWTCGAITVPAPTNATAGTSGLIRITAGPVVWNAVFKFPGGTAPTIASFPAIIPFYVQNSTNILMGNVSEGIA